MSEAFENAVSFTLKYEGGYVNNPSDSGGETNFGISKRSYPEIDIKNLTAQKAKEIYYKDYWLGAGCDKLPPLTATALFDTGVNVGVSQAKKWLDTTKADADSAKQILDKREEFYMTLVAKNSSKYSQFLRGWNKRVAALRSYLGLDSIKKALPLPLLALAGVALWYAIKKYKLF